MSTTGHIHQDSSGAYTWERNSSQFLLVNKVQTKSYPYKDHLSTQKKKRDRVIHFLNQEVSVKKGIIRTFILVVDFSKHILLEEKNSTLQPTESVDFDEVDHIQDKMEDDLEIQNDRAFARFGSSSIFTSRTSSGQQKLVISRRDLVFSCLEEFIPLFFESNPLSSMGLVIVKDSRSKIVLTPTDSKEVLLREVRYLRDGPPESCSTPLDYFPSGYPSIVAGLRIARQQLRMAPSFSTRELLYINSTVQTSYDSSISIFSTIHDLKKSAISCNVISFGGEIFILSKLASLTRGRHVVPLHVLDFRDKLLSMAKPQPLSSHHASASPKSMLIPMGFPRKINNVDAFCLCHSSRVPSGYECPRCKSLVCSLPTKCASCSLFLCSSPDLARYFHHLFPVKTFLDVPSSSLSSSSPLPCFACNTLMYAHSSVITSCPSCHQYFCVDCDAFIHESLHNCPGCESSS
mmetsp:Transcript_1742/g.2574  ORF Transcript_1742/g.2574 Transcript_1742/m.2574 type:complete len:461 (+) Transcript_1742:287-1669(+)